MVTACESHSFSDIMTHALFTLGAVVELLAHAVRASMKISPQREQRVPEEVRGGCKRVCICVCVQTCDTVIYYSSSMYLDTLNSAFLDRGSFYLGWLGFRHLDSVVGGLWKITIFARQLAKGCLPPAPPSTPITAGLQGWA